MEGSLNILEIPKMSSYRFYALYRIEKELYDEELREKEEWERKNKSGDYKGSSNVSYPEIKEDPQSLDLLDECRDVDAFLND